MYEFKKLTLAAYIIAGDLHVYETYALKTSFGTQ